MNTTLKQRFNRLNRIFLTRLKNVICGKQSAKIDMNFGDTSVDFATRQRTGTHKFAYPTVLNEKQINFNAATNLFSRHTPVTLTRLDGP